MSTSSHATDVTLQRILSAPTWRARFFEAAASSAAAIVEYSLRHQDAMNAMVWMERLRFFREKARPSGDSGTVLHRM
jgi:hypothetical protein